MRLEHVEGEADVTELAHSRSEAWSFQLGAVPHSDTPKTRAISAGCKQWKALLAPEYFEQEADQICPILFAIGRGGCRWNRCRPIVSL